MKIAQCGTRNLSRKYWEFLVFYLADQQSQHKPKSDKSILHFLSTSGFCVTMAHVFHYGSAFLAMEKKKKKNIVRLS